MSDENQPAINPQEQEIVTLLSRLVTHAPSEAVKTLRDYPAPFAAEMLTLLNPSLAQDVLGRFPLEQKRNIVAAADPATRGQWVRNEHFPEGTIGRLMEPALAVFHPDTTVADAAEALRHMVKRAFISYIFVVDERERLLGIVAMREMLLAQPSARLESIMTLEPFYLSAEMPILEAMRETMLRHYPAYPVCDHDGKLLGLLRGQMLFEAETVELSLQAGSLVGVEKEERLDTPWWRSFRLRHP